jgi:hypothetical protein
MHWSVPYRHVVAACIVVVRLGKHVEHQVLDRADVLKLVDEDVFVQGLGAATHLVEPHEGLPALQEHVVERNPSFPGPLFFVVPVERHEVLVVVLGLACVPPGAVGKTCALQVGVAELGLPGSDLFHEVPLLDAEVTLVEALLLS